MKPTQATQAGAFLAVLLLGKCQVTSVNVYGDICGGIPVGDSAQAGAAGYFDGWGGYFSGTSPQRFRWSSANPAVLGISSSGVMRAQAVGVTSISAEVEGVVGSAEFKTVTPPSFRASLSQPSVSLRMGDSIDVTVLLIDSAGVPAPPALSLFSTGTTRIAQIGAVYRDNHALPGVYRVRGNKAGTQAADWCVSTQLPPATAGRYGLFRIEVNEK